MVLSESGIKLLKQFEGCKLRAYKCSASRWTIGFGNTYYEDGTQVKEGDIITQERSEELLMFILESFVLSINQLVKSPINQNQFDSLVSFIYNVGPGNFQKSTLLKKVNLNPNDHTIAQEFLKWNKVKTKVIKGLTTRRQLENTLYFTLLPNL